MIIIGLIQIYPANEIKGEKTQMIDKNILKYKSNIYGDEFRLRHVI